MNIEWAHMRPLGNAPEEKQASFNQKGNLVLLCRYCHGETEGMEPENVLTYILTTEFVGPLGSMMNRLETACGFTEEEDSNEFEDYLGNVGL